MVNLVDYISEKTSGIHKSAGDFLKGMVSDVYYAGKEIWTTIYEAIFGAPPDSPDPEDTSYQQRIKNDDAVRIVYGERMIAGNLVYMNVSSDNRYLYAVISLCEGPIDSIQDVYIDDELVYESGSRKSYTTAEDADDSKYDRVQTYWTDYSFQTGTFSQTVPTGVHGANWVNEMQEGEAKWSSNHRLRALANAYFKFEWNANTWSRMPKVKFVVKGRKIYDPRTVAGQTASTASTWTYSVNPALVVLDYLRNGSSDYATDETDGAIHIKGRYGCSIPDSEIDMDSFGTSADICDVSITLYGSTTGARWTCNTVIDPSRKILENLKQLLYCFGGQLTWSAGQYKLITETTHSGDTVFDFDTDHIIGDYTVQGESKRSRYNKVFGNYVNPDNAWQKDEIYFPTTDFYFALDNNTPLEKTLDFRCIIDPYRATNMAKRILLRSRNSLAMAITVTAEGLNCIPGDIVSITHSTLGFTSKKFRVQEVKFNVDGTVDLTLVEHDDATYSEETSDQYVAPSDTNLPSPSAISTPTGLAFSEELFETIGSAGVQVRVTLSWDSPINLFFEHHIIEWKQSDLSTWSRGSTIQNQMFIDGLKPTEYDFRVQAVTSSGTKSGWISLEDTTVAGLTSVPSNVSNFSCIALDGSVHAHWDAPTDLDVKIGGRLRVRHSSLTSGATWASSNDISKAIPSHNTSTVLPLIGGTYLAKWVDSSGQNSATAVSSIVSNPTVQQFNAVSTTSEHPGWSGSKSTMKVSDEELLLSNLSVTFGGTDLMNGTELSGATVTISDKVTGTTSDTLTITGDQTFSSSYSEQWVIVGLQDGESYTAMDQVVSSGNYISSAIDLGSVYTSRVKTAPNVSFTNLQGTDTTIDNWPISITINEITNWDTGSYAVDDVHTETYIRTTNDNPAGSPTWSEYARFRTGDFKARGYQFKLTAESEDSFHQANISEWDISIDMPDRIKTGSGTSHGSTATTVTYDTTVPYYVTPKLALTFNGLGSGDFYDLSSESTSGFTFTLKDSGNNVISKTYEYMAKGY